MTAKATILMSIAVIPVNRFHLSSEQMEHFSAEPSIGFHKFTKAQYFVVEEHFHEQLQATFIVSV